MEERKIPVILDVDTGVDDAMALALAAASDRLEILGLTAVYGNRPVDETAHNTLKVAEQLGLDVPVAKGASRALLDPPIDYSLQPVVDIHGADGLGNCSPMIPEPKGALCPLTACELMAEILSASEEKVTLVATGPLTNVALFLLGYPHLHGKVERILFMGGAAHGGNLRPSVEANTGHDPEAAAVVLTSGLPVCMFGLDATMGCFITEEERLSMRDAGQTGAFLCDCLAGYSGIYRALAGLPGAVLHDSLPVAWLIDGTVAELKDCRVAMDLDGGGTRGCTVTDVGNIWRREPNARVAMSADREKFICMQLDAVRKFR